jgi:hypothetical protein
MAPVTAETIEQTTAWLVQIDDETEVDAMIDALSQEQPVLFAYLMEIGGDDFNEDERELLLFLGVLIWKSMTASGEVAELNEQTLEQVKTENMKMLEYLSDESEAAFRMVAGQMMKDYRQPELLRSVLEWIADEEDSAVRPENRGMMMMFLKIIIDCLDA